MPSPYRPSASAPQRYYPYPTPYYPPPPPPAPLSREERLRRARGHRANAIGLLVVGLSLNVAGVILMGYGGAVPQGGYTSIANGINVTEVLFGITGSIVGITLWAPGAAAFVEWDRSVHTLEREGAARKAILFGAPVVRF